MEWSEEAEKTESINGERRRDRRYGIHLDLRWKLIRRRRVLETGVGQTVDLSSGGILFVSGRTLPVGLNVELAITWPVLLRNEAPMQLIVAGRIVRTGANGTAVEMVQHEFRTMSTSSDQRGRQGSRRPCSCLSAAVEWPSANIGNDFSPVVRGVPARSRACSSYWAAEEWEEQPRVPLPEPAASSPYGPNEWR